MITLRKAEEKDKSAVKILAEMVHKLHVENRPDIYHDVSSMTDELFSSLLLIARLLLPRKMAVLSDIAHIV